MSSNFTESVVEDAALEWFGELDYSISHDPEIGRADIRAVRQTSTAPSTVTNCRRRQFSPAWNTPVCLALVVHQGRRGQDRLGSRSPARPFDEAS